ncbi:MAG TPA: CsbD family protein [Pseudonocardiaceae bacterium]
MSLADKARNKAEELLGQAKKAVGEATDDDQLQVEGKTDQVRANIKQAGEKIKDAFKK